VPTPRELHRAGTTVTSVLLVGLGVAILVTTVVNGGGVLALGMLLGVLFLAAGAGRLWVARRKLP
jgi:hypothetical protein